MTITTKSPPVAPQRPAVADVVKAATKAGALGLLRRLGRALANGPGDLLWYAGAHNQDDKVKDAPAGKETTQAILLQEKTARDNKVKILTVAMLIAGIGSGGWWPLSALAGIALTAAVFAVVQDHKDAARWGWLFRAATAFIPTVASLWATKLGEWPTWWFATTIALVCLTVLALTGGDGTYRDNLTGDVQRLDQPEQPKADAPRVVLSIARGLKVKDEGASKEVAVIGDPTKDRRGIWTVTHFQLATKTVADLENKEALQRVAAGLRKDRSWVFIDRVAGDESQGRAYVADANPWPSTPSPWPGLATLHHDAWLPAEFGTDLFTGEPFLMPPAQAGELAGGSPGAGKTALQRLGCLIVASDAASLTPGAEMDIWDAKDDGALDMFRPVCVTYGAGDDDQTAHDFNEWLKWVRHVEGPRRKKVIKSLGTDLCKDGRLTRELARNPQVGLRLRVTHIDEVQDFLNHPKYGAEIEENLTYAAKQLRSSGWRIKVATQKPTSDAISTAIRSVLPVRVGLRAEDYETSKATLGTGALRADMLPAVEGAAIIRAAGDGASFRGHVKIRMHYVDLAQAQAHVQRLVTARPATAAPERPGPPRILLEIRRLIDEKGTDGRILTRDLVPALTAYHLLDQGGTEQERAEQLADLVRPYGVRSCADRARSNAMSYWLEKVDARGNQVGVVPAIQRVERGSPAPHYAGSPAHSPGGSTSRRGLRAV